VITVKEVWLRAWVRRARQLRGKRNDIDGAVDRPLPGQPFVHGFEVAGWAAVPGGSAPIVAVHVGGAKVWEGQADLPRTDAGPEARGFSVFLKASQMPRHGRFPWLRVTARPQGASEAQAKVLHSMPLQRGRLLSSLPRWAYGSVWDRASRSLYNARLSVAGYADQAEWDRSGEETARHIATQLCITTDHQVLEIGCGAGRVGDKLAPRCRHWTGADVSQNMLGHAREALQRHGNVSLVHLNGFDLAGIADASQDVVYCTAVFMHLDEWDRYRYVTEFFRVLRPGGRVYFDNFDLRSPDGWKLFTDMANLDVAMRPPNVSKASTSEELTWYAERAGFEDISAATGMLWLTVVGRKPASA
jgi:ubiquinone/menaquinone biosynthesis C-methylase UbiE